MKEYPLDAIDAMQLDILQKIAIWALQGTKPGKDGFLGLKLQRKMSEPNRAIKWINTSV